LLTFLELPYYLEYFLRKFNEKNMEFIPVYFKNFCKIIHYYFIIKQPTLNQDQGPYSQHFIFFVTYESAQYARLQLNTRAERLVSDKNSNLLGLVLSYEENKVLWVRTLTQRSPAENLIISGPNVFLIILVNYNALKTGLM